MATENNLNNHNVHQEEKEDNLHDLEMDTTAQNNDDHSQIMEMVEQGKEQNFFLKDLNFSFCKKLCIPSTVNTDYLLWHTQSIVCTTVDSQCLEYLG